MQGPRLLVGFSKFSTNEIIWKVTPYFGTHVCSRIISEAVAKSIIAELWVTNHGNLVKGNNLHRVAVNYCDSRNTASHGDFHGHPGSLLSG